MALKFIVPAVPDVAKIGAVTVTEPKPESKPEVKAQEGKTTIEQQSVVSELVELWRLYEQHNMKKVCAQIEKLKKELQSIANDNAPEADEVLFACKEGTVLFSPRGQETKVNDPMQLVQHLAEKFGAEVAFSVVKIGLTELKKVMSEKEMEEFCTKKPGSRTLKVVLPKED